MQVTGQGGVPSTGVSAVVLNVSATDTSDFSYLTAWPYGSAKPNAANLNWSPGRTIANRIVVPVGTGGKIQLSNASGSADLIVDVNGWYTDSSNSSATGSRYVATSPTRICDTRPVTLFSVASNQCNQTLIGYGTLGPGATSTIAVAGQGGVPTGATGAVLNVAVTNTTQGDFLTLWPDDGSSRPNASDLNWQIGDTLPNLVVAKLPTSGTNPGKLNIFNLDGYTDVIVDVEGYYVP